MNFLFIKQKRHILLVLSVFLFFIGCWEFISINQPDLADPNSTFEVPITVFLTNSDSTHIGYSGTDKRGYFGIRLPLGWTVKDSIIYQGVINGTFIYSGAYSDSMEMHENSPAGYYWWVGVSDSMDSLPSGNISFIPHISTDSQTGTFSIDYMLSDRIGSFGDQVVHSRPIPILVGIVPTVETVTNTNDSGEGSLRQALNDVSFAGEIIFDLSYPATIVIDSSLNIDHNVTIAGPESSELTISGNSASNGRGVLFIGGNYHLSVNINNLRICNGRRGIDCIETDLNLTNVKVMNNSGGPVGAGIQSWKTSLNLTDVTIANNFSFGEGGGIYCYGKLDLNNVKIINNSAYTGGGIFSHYSTLNLANVTIAHNYAMTDGGGIKFHYDSFMAFDSIDRCNIYSNIAGNAGDDLASEPNDVFNIIVDTFTVMNPTEKYASPIELFNFNILNAKMPTSINESDIRFPKTYSLSQNYPNPFNPKTTIEFFLPKAEFVTLKIYNLLGQEVAMLISDKLTPDNYKYNWDASAFASGVYYYKIEAGKFAETKKLILLK